MAPLKLRWLLFLLPCVLTAQELTFSEKPPEPWLNLWQYNVSVCQSSGQSMIVQGAWVWAQAGKAGIQPRTHAQLQSILTKAKKTSKLEIGLSTIEAVSWGFSAVTPLIGRQWPSGQQMIAPMVAGGLRLADVLLRRHAEPPPAIPADYLPGLIDVPAGPGPQGCWNGVVIGGLR